MRTGFADARAYKELCRGEECDSRRRKCLPQITWNELQATAQVTPQRQRRSKWLAPRPHVACTLSWQMLLELLAIQLREQA